MKRVILFTLFAMNLVEQPAPEVIIDQGVLSGKISDDGSFFEYLGIPYASTNIRTRFQAPLPAPSWQGTFRATDEHYQCPQNFPSVGVIGTEDCLKINVYVPAMAPKPLPVMVYIHGGAFILGSGGKLIYAPDFLLKHDVIVVTFNYRLGPLGFLCLNIKEAPGNAGLKDQLAALKWVKKNIAEFGGDPDNVTIFGHSAGGASVALQVASDKSEGLFQRAVIQSGSSLGEWSITRNPIASASHLAKLLGYDLSDPKDIYNLFSKLPYKDLIAATAHIPMGKLSESGVFHLPCVEKSFPETERFLGDFPYNLLTRMPKNITLMYGFTDKEGLLFIPDETDDTLKQLNHWNLHGDDLIFKSKEEEMKVTNDLKKFYFGNEEISRKTIMNLTDLYTDLRFKMPVILEAELMAKSKESPTYIYYFTYSGGRNMVKDNFGFKNESGACHGDDILYIFKGKVWPYKISNADQRIIDLLTKSLTNFAKYGNPTPDFITDLPIRWLPNDKEKLRFLYIGDELSMGLTPKPDAFQLWKNIYEKYRLI